MSNSVYDLVLGRKVGANTQKQVLLYMAGRASDDGSGVWASKARMARELEMTKNPILKALNELITKGLISEVGKRPCSSGYTIVYHLNLHSIAALETTEHKNANQRMNFGNTVAQGVQEVNPIQADGNVQGVHDVHPPSAADEPQGVHDVNPNPPLTIQKTSAADAASTNDLDFDDFLNAHPRPKDPVKSRKLFNAAVASGMAVADLLKAAQIYAEQQKCQPHRFIAGSDAGLERRGYEDALRRRSKAGSAPSATLEEVRKMQARSIIAGREYHYRNFRSDVVADLIKRKLVSKDLCRDLGIQF